jgi:hypothetical protein
MLKAGRTNDKYYQHRRKIVNVRDVLNNLPPVGRFKNYNTRYWF